MKTIIAAIFAFVLVTTTFDAEAQTYAESALTFSRIRPGGSARIQAMGGAQVSLGGDFSSALSNPAGLGMYNRSEFAIMPAMNFTNTSSSYFDNSSNAARSNFAIPGASIAFHKDRGDYGFLGGTFAISITRTNDFNRTLSYEGMNNNNSLIDYFISQSNGYPVSQFDQGGDLDNTVTQLGYNNYLFDENPSVPNQYDSYGTDGFPYQSEVIETSGKQNQWSFSYGANFDDKFFLGAGIGFTSIKFKSKKTYMETMSGVDLRSFTLNEFLDITGSGVNFTIGGIYRPIEQLQLGASFISPTYYSLNDSYHATMGSSWNTFPYTGAPPSTQETATVVSTYNLTTPARASVGATFFLNKRGFITADFEHVNYAKAKYASTDNSGISYSGDNSEIKSLYRSVNNYRVGGEFRFSSFRARAGYSLMTDPYLVTQNGVSAAIQSVSGGMGYRSEKFFIDLAVVYSFYDGSYRPYQINSPQSPVMTYNQNGTTMMITLGFPF